LDLRNSEVPNVDGRIKACQEAVFDAALEQLDLPP
jgi:hypothetical protein